MAEIKEPEAEVKEPERKAEEELADDAMEGAAGGKCNLPTPRKPPSHSPLP
jgi:hypothetical protein